MVLSWGAQDQLDKTFAFKYFVSPVGALDNSEQLLLREV